MKTFKSKIKIIIEIAKCDKKQFFIVMGAVIILGISLALDVVLVQRALNHFADANRTDAIIAVLLLFGIGTFILLLYNFFPYLQQKFIENVKEILLEKYIKLVNETEPEALIYEEKCNQLSEVRSSIDKLYHSGISGALSLIQTIISALSLAGILIYIVRWSPLVIILGVLINIYLTKKAAKLEIDSTSMSTEPKRYEKSLLDILTVSKYAKELRLSFKTNWFMNKWKSQNNQLLKFTTKRMLLASIYSIGAGVIGGLLNLCLLIYGIYLLSNEIIKAGEVAALFMSGVYLEQILFMSLMQGKNWIATGVYLDPIFRDHEYEKNNDITITRNEDENNALVLKNVSFKYKNNDDFSISGIHLSVPSGAKVAVVGPNGAGKTTLMAIIAGLYKPYEGEVKSHPIGANIIQGFGKYKLKLKENIFLGDIHKKDDVSTIEQSIDLVNADFVSSLENKEETLLWEEMGGVQLSEGQWQKIAIARGVFRSIYRSNAIIILDEPSSVLDTKVELELLKNIMEYFKDYTIFFVVHRLVGCNFADHILVVNEGKIDAFGSHDEVLNESECYRKMWSASTSFMK